MPIDDERPASDSPPGVPPTPITGHHAPLDGFPARVIVCEVWGLAATLDTIDALARLQLSARRRGYRVRLRNLDGALEELIAFIGLRDTLPLCVSTEHPLRTPLRAPIDTPPGGWRPATCGLAGEFASPPGSESMNPPRGDTRGQSHGGR